MIWEDSPDAFRVMDHPEMKFLNWFDYLLNIVRLATEAKATPEILFGKELAQNTDFVSAALAYVEETLICTEVVRLLPTFLIPLKSQEVIFETLLPVAEQRCKERNQRILGQETPQHADCIQWIMETSPKKNPWTAKRVIHELMAIWFGSVHALSTTITFAIEDLCLHPEYTQPLREELRRGYTEFECAGDGLPLLDSFLKESARLTPVESMSTRRAALRPFTLSDGTRLEPGDWACTPVRAIMTDPISYPLPFDFNGFRFATTEEVQRAGSSFKALQRQHSKFTTVDESFHVWGTGRMACPGRYYAVAVMKVVLGQIIMNYDLDLVDKKAPRWFTWRSTMLPKSSTKVVFTPL
ncbi:cytochrome P450 [Xylaria sp. FL0933]|nr:cytochrome P450 [Xylaria sp. FL0933]